MTVTHASPAVQKFCEIWKDCFTSVLAQLGAASPSASIIGQPAAGVTTSLDSGLNVFVRFSGGGSIAGDFLWVAEKPVALQCAQLLMSEPLNPSLEFNDSHRDAFAELLRQVAGPVATAWKQETGNEIQLNFQPGDTLALNAALSAALRLSGEKIPGLSLSLLLSPDLCQSLAAAPAESVPPAQPDASPRSPQSDSSAQELFSSDEPLAPPAEAPGPLPSNLELLLDIELEATIRFGQHEMLLRDIFGLMPGVVVELDQMVNEPAELLVAGRLIARGEVVVVDGNFGLQVTEVASASQRAEILQLHGRDR